MHIAALGFFFNAVTGLALGADEEHIFAAGDGLLHEPLGAEKALDGLLHVNDVDHIALAQDVRLHLGVPATDAVSEMNARIHERFNEFRLRRSHDSITPKRTATASPETNSGDEHLNNLFRTKSNRQPMRDRPAKTPVAAIGLAH